MALTLKYNKSRNSVVHIYRDVVCENYESVYVCVQCCEKYDMRDTMSCCGMLFEMSKIHAVVIKRDMI